MIRGEKEWGEQLMFWFEFAELVEATQGANAELMHSRFARDVDFLDQVCHSHREVFQSTHTLLPPELQFKVTKDEEGEAPETFALRFAVVEESCSAAAAEVERLGEILRNLPAGTSAHGEALHHHLAQLRAQLDLFHASLQRFTSCHEEQFQVRALAPGKWL